MKREFSSYWKKSKKPRKQRKYRVNAPFHIKRKFLSSTLSKELRKKYKKRSIPTRKGDKVKILRGQFKNNTGTITSINLKKSKVYVDTAHILKKDGTKAFYPISTSNLAITELSIEDKLRRKALGRIKENVSSKKTDSA